MTLLKLPARHLIWKPDTKTKLRMKWSIVFLFICCIHVRATGYSQSVTLKLKNASLQKVMTEINRQTGYQYFYKDALLDKAGKITVQLKDLPLEQALEHCFKGSELQFSIVEKTIVIKSKDNKPLASAPTIALPSITTTPALQIIRGKVTNEKGEALAGASVVIKGSTVGTTTDANGNFSINVPSGGALVISYVGYGEKTLLLDSRTEYSVQLKAAEVASQEAIVVIGYGTQKITKVSGAVSTIKGSDVQKLTPVRVEEALQGNASGVNVIQSGSPGSKPAVYIRGIPDLGGSEPTVIVDGVQQTTNDLNSINPSDIESINVLKDAATTAIYGVKGGNGVIVITTKGGRKNQVADINLTSSYSIQEVTNTLPVLNATQYATMLNEGSVLSGGDVIFKDISKLGVGTNWQNETFKNAPLQTHNISVRGGSDKITYFLGAGYLSQGGIVGGLDKSRFDRLNFTSNLNFDISSKVKFTLNATYLNLYSKGVAENAFNSIIGSAVNYDPTVSIYNTVPNTIGTYGYSSLITREIFNPLTKLENTYNNNKGGKLYGKFELQYAIRKNLKVTGRLGYTKYDGNAKTFTPLAFYGTGNVDNTLNADGTTVTGAHNSVSHDKATYNSLSYEAFTNYNKTIAGTHDFDVTAGIALNQANGNTAGASRQDVPYNSWAFADFTAATGSTANNNSNGLRGYYFQYFSKHASGFARINYDYNEKYLASFTARRDGSYAFGVDNKFANFYSGSLGWVVSKESFFNIDKVNQLKIRGSYGTVGNDNNLDPKRVLVTIQTDYLASLYGSGNSIGYTYGNVFYPGSTIASIANTALKWERQEQGNIGLDLAAFSNKLYITVDYFQKKTNGLLFVPAASGYLGTIPAPVANIGSTKTSGIDLTLGYNTKLAKAVSFNNTLTFTTAKNTVTKVSDDGHWEVGGNYFNGQSQTVTIFAQGYAPATYYGYKTNGLFQTWDEVSKSAKQNGAQPGDIKFVDVNGDNVIDATDRTVIGNPFPDFTMGWNAVLNIHNIDFTVFTYASVGNDVYRAFERNDNYTNKYASVLNRWTGANTTNDARYPRYSFTDANNNSRVSDRYVEDGSFAKIKNILLGYTVPAKATKVFKGLRIYAQVKNAFTFTKYQGFDPEIAGNGLLDTGIDRGAYPQARMYTIGLDVKF